MENLTQLPICQYLCHFPPQERLLRRLLSSHKAEQRRGREEDENIAEWRTESLGTLSEGDKVAI